MLSIFYPYIGTDMYDVATETGSVESTGKYFYERRAPIYDSPAYPKCKVRRDYFCGFMYIKEYGHGIKF